LVDICLLALRCFLYPYGCKLSVLKGNGLDFLYVIESGKGYLVTRELALDTHIALVDLKVI
jgi:hypothetical protein